jgi:hypothetical protein
LVNSLPFSPTRKSSIAQARTFGYCLESVAIFRAQLRKSISNGREQGPAFARSADRKHSLGGASPTQMSMPARCATGANSLRRSSQSVGMSQTVK